MKRILLTCLIMMLGMLCYAEPIPQQEQAGADTPYYMDEHNILREKPKQEKIEEIQEKIDEQLIDETNNTEVEQIPSDIPENVPSDLENNPINFDASKENIQDKNYKPIQNIDSTDDKKNIDKKSKQKTEKKKKNKKTENKTNNLEDVMDGTDSTQESDAENNPEEPTSPKTYSQDDYEQIYRDMPVPTHTYMHGVDPEQYYDMKDSTWSPYPLLRLNAPLYFKTITIPPGYYLLTPRKYKDDWFILFKEAGVVKYTIPVFEKGFTPEFYYRDNLKELDMTKSQRWQIKFLNAWGKYIRKSKHRPPIKTNVELTDLDNNFLLIDLYYGGHKYSVLFRTEKF